VPDYQYFQIIKHWNKGILLFYKSIYEINSENILKYRNYSQRVICNENFNTRIHHNMKTMIFTSFTSLLLSSKATGHMS
jgi:hypothetical protein